MDSLTTVVIKPGEADRIVAGHPWVYEGSILRLIGQANDGGVVQLKDHRQRFLGIGFYNSKSRIRVRVLASERVTIDEAFFESRIRGALSIRERHLPGANSFRVVNAESDFLSGLIVDKYEDVLVIQTSSLGMDQRKGAIVTVLEKMLRPRAILERNDTAFRKFEGMADSNELLSGVLPDSGVVIDFNGLKFKADLRSGHKTGLYLDQQANYRLVAGLARGQVLDCFTFLGGFALHAARAGADHVHGIDQSEEAVGAAVQHAEMNGLSAKCTFEAANVFDWLKAQTVINPHERLIPRFDTIILDPPSFTRSRASVPDALRGYKEIHLRALKLLKTNGTLATFCCSHHVDAATFEAIILEAAFDARRVVRRVATFAQSPDHPIIPSIPETEYLKGFAFELAK